MICLQLWLITGGSEKFAPPSRPAWGTRCTADSSGLCLHARTRRQGIPSTSCQSPDPPARTGPNSRGLAFRHPSFRPRLQSAVIDYVSEDGALLISAHITLNSKRWFTAYHSKLQALVYHMLPSTTAVFSYATGSTENCQLTSSFFCWCSNSGKFVTNDSDYIRRLFLQLTTLLTPTQIKPKSFESRRNYFFYPG